MGLPDHIIQQFVKVTNDSCEKPTEPTSYGTIVEYNDSLYVRLDGAEEITPVTLTVAAKAGDRVTVTLKNHQATVTGNLTDPSASGDKLHEATITIEGMNIKMKGFVTFEGLSGGTTTIDGACIKTGIIDAKRLNLTGYVTEDGLSTGITTIDGGCIKTGTIDADRLSLTGAITFYDLSESLQGDIEDALDTADDAYDLAYEVDDVVSGWTYGSSTYIDGSMIMTGTVKASELLGGTVGLLNSSEDEVGRLTISGSSSSTYSIKLASDGALALYAYNGNVHIESDDGAEILLSDEVRLGGGDTRPNGRGYTCGTSSYPWDDVYSKNAECNTSDLNKKKEIEYGLDSYNSLFDDLKPVTFKFKENKSDRRHIGLIAQDVEDSMNKCGISSKDFAAFIKSPKKDEEGNVVENEYNYSLRYGELISLCIEQIQQLKARVAELENQNGVQ